jgi:hypothetical protein
MSTPSESQVDLLFDLAASRPDGFTYKDVNEVLGWDRPYFIKVARYLRLAFAEDKINLVCNPQGKNEPWLYELVGTLDDSRAWTTNRLLDAETRLHTVWSVAKSIVEGTDGRSREGRRARIIARACQRANEDLHDLDNAPSH